LTEFKDFPVVTGKNRDVPNEQINIAAGGLYNFGKVAECPVYLGSWVCAVCCRSGKDFRHLFCRVRTSSKDGVR
jgi:hypothetical protein